MSYALLFPGQGTQHPHMLAWLEAQPAAAPLLQQLAAQIGPDWRTTLADAERSRDNHFAQLLLTGLCLAAWRCIAPLLPPPAVVAGYSVGELPAFAAAGVFSDVQALALAVARSDCMSRSVAGLHTGLLSVNGAPAALVSDVTARWQLDVAIELAPDRCVLGGLDNALTAAEAQLAAAGARCQRLAVALASHTRHMQAAVAGFAPHVQALPFAAGHTPLVCNLSGALTRGAPALRQALTEQLACTVRWQQAMETIAERRPLCVLEVGPGSTLSKLWNDTQAGIPARSADEFRSPQAAAQWVRQEVLKSLA
jgi:[acyl-carrier-protein] S-malonyltransferase